MDLDQTPHSAVSDSGLHCLTVLFCCVCVCVCECVCVWWEGRVNLCAIRKFLKAQFFKYIVTLRPGGNNKCITISIVQVTAKFAHHH